MRRWLLLLLGATWVGSSMAQQEVTMQAPFAGIIQGTQLWNIVMVNATSAPIWVRLNVNITRTTDNQVMETVNSAIVTLAAGAHQMSASDFGPYVVSYLSAGFPDITNSSSLLPANYYQVCYDVDKIIGDASRPAAEQCNEVEVQPLSPPQLVYPADSSAIPNPYPQFSWSPPAPITMLPNLHYDLKVVELQAGQSYAQAIQSNIPVFSQGQLTQANLGYPAAATSLQSGKSYLWQVTAVSGQYSMQSEVWQFYKGETSDSVTKPSRVLSGPRPSAGKKTGRNIFDPKKTAKKNK